MSVMLLRKNASIHPSTCYKSQCPIPVIFSMHRARCNSVILNEHLCVFPVEQGGTRRWDAEWAEALTFHCRPLSHVYYELHEIASKFSVKMRVLFWALNPSFTAHSSYISIRTRYYVFFLSFESKLWVIQSNVYNILEEAGGNVPQATLNQVIVSCCVWGSAVFMKPVCCFVRHDGKMKVCFAVASSVFREQAQTGWLQFACSSVAEMDGWHVWFH